MDLLDRRRPRSTPWRRRDGCTGKSASNLPPTSVIPTDPGSRVVFPHQENRSGVEPAATVVGMRSRSGAGGERERERRQVRQQRSRIKEEGDGSKLGEEPDSFLTG